jgi:1-acyl-sn-glycerol-3-phosphate acyltransferase
MYKGLLEFLHKPKLEQFWSSFAEGLSRYFRMEVEGLEHIPLHGSAIIAPNHSGCAGADAIILAHLISSRVNRPPKILAHRAYFEYFRMVRAISKSFGLEKASIKDGVRVLKKDQLLLLFPEAEMGNFKPSSQMYKLQDFHTGFVRLSLEAKVPIIPALVIGAEESNLNFGNIDLSRFVKGLRIPLPFNILPLPSKWKVIFLEPIHLYDSDSVQSSNFDSVSRASNKIKTQMQARLKKEVAKREYVYFETPSS